MVAIAVDSWEMKPEDDMRPDQLGPEPKGFWEPIVAQVNEWVERYRRDESTS